jgi:hypothetical protein
MEFGHRDLAPAELDDTYEIYEMYAPLPEPVELPERDSRLTNERVSDPIHVLLMLVLTGYQYHLLCPL